MNSIPDSKLTGQYRLSAIINGAVGLFLLLLGGVFFVAWLVFGLLFHSLLQLVGLVTAGAGLLGAAAICLAVAAYHFSKWRSTPQI